MTDHRSSCLQPAAGGAVIASITTRPEETWDATS